LEGNKKVARLGERRALPPLTENARLDATIQEDLRGKKKKKENDQ